LAFFGRFAACGERDGQRNRNQNKRTTHHPSPCYPIA
jgi:hypothetical protein